MLFAIAQMHERTDILVRNDDDTSGENDLNDTGSILLKHYSRIITNHFPYIIKCSGVGYPFSAIFIYL